MATLNNKNIYKKISYIQNQLVYNNIPIDVFAIDPTTNIFVRTDKIKIQGFKMVENATIPEEDRMTYKIGNELIEGVDFSVAINNTNNGVNITLFNNIVDADIIEIRRDTPKDFVNNYNQLSSSTNLKEALNTDINKAGNIVQEQGELISDLRNNTGKYTAEINKRGVFSVHGRKGDVVSENGDYNASQIAFASSLLTSTNTQEAINELVIRTDEIAKGTTPRTACRFAADTNIDLLNTSSIDGVALNLQDRVLVKSQTILGQNGVYVYSSLSTLTRANDNNTLSLIAGTKVQILEGVFAEKQYQIIVDNITTGVLDTEPIKIELVYNAVAEYQITNQKLSKAPSNTYKGNNQNTLNDITDIPTKTAFNKDFEENPDNIKTNGEVSIGALDTIARADHTHPTDITRASQNDLESLNASTTIAINNILTAVGEKQNLLPFGGDNQYIGYENNQIVSKDFTKSLIGLENVDNTRDIDKPISNPQKIEFDKTYRHLGNLLNSTNGNTDLNVAINLNNGIYSIMQGDVPSIVNLPPDITANSNLSFEIFNLYNGTQKIGLKQIITSIGENKLYFRTYNSITNVFTGWSTIATNTDIAFLDNKINSLVLDGLQGVVPTIQEFNDGLASKQDKLTEGTANQIRLGDNTLADKSTDTISEGLNLYYTSERARGTPLTGYAVLNTETTENDSILQALGKKVDLSYASTQLSLKANVVSPTLQDPKANTPAANDNSTRIATTEFVKNVKSDIPLTYVFASSSQNIISGAYTKVNFTAVLINDGNFFNTTTMEFKPTRAGWYNCSSQVQISNNGAQPWFTNLRFKFSGQATIPDFRSYCVNGDESVEKNQMFYFNGTTDYLTVEALRNGTITTPIIFAGSYFQAQFIK